MEAHHHHRMVVGQAILLQTLWSAAGAQMYRMGVYNFVVTVCRQYVFANKVAIEYVSVCRAWIIVILFGFFFRLFCFD